jgi:hypothetical protein
MDAGVPMDPQPMPDGGVMMTPPSGYAGRLATVLVEDALIGPSKADRTPWDPGAAIPPEVITGLAKALGAVDPFAAALGVVGGPTLNAAITASQKPDTYGTIRMDALGKIGTEYPLATREERTEDSFTPVVPGPTGYRMVPIDADVRLRIHLRDADLFDSDDEVGVAVINAEDIRAAFAARKKYQVPVWDQTNNQILFVGISVLGE